MPKINLNRKGLLTYLFLLVLIIVIYWKALSGYFQSDEWFYFKEFLPLARENNGLLLSFYKSIFDAQSISGGGHMAPVYNILWFLHNKLFGLNYLPYILLSILTHSFNSFLVFLLAKKLLDRYATSLVAGIFFAISPVHFQAITWIMAYIPTQVSVFFMLISLISLINFLKSFDNKVKNGYLFSWFIFSLLALLTKESAFILFLITPFLVFLKRKKVLFSSNFIKVYILSIFLYFPYRFILPFYINPKSNLFFTTLDPYLQIFRLITYSLKLLVEIFIPMPLLLNIAENLTPLAYPTYGVEKEVRGSGFLTFTQSAGSDMLIYIFAFIILSLIINALFYFRKKSKDRQLHALLFAIALIATSSIPLLFISTYSPWWGYVTFIDSRHLYICSIGAAIIFAMTFSYLLQKIKENFRLALVILPILIFWIITQYTVLQNQLTQDGQIGGNRVKILKSIIPQKINQNKYIIFIESNIGYYGFGPIPPFQTNLGQIMYIIFYQNGLLSIDFLKDDFLSKAGINGEGYKEIQGKGFGYFINKKTLFESYMDNKFSPESVTGYLWDGKNDTLTNQDSEIRNELYELKKHLNEYKTWKEGSLDDKTITLKIPPEAVISKTDNLSPQVEDEIEIALNTGQKIKISLIKKTYNIGIFEDISLYANTDGKIIGDDFYYRGIKMLNGQDVTMKIPLYGSQIQYYLPTIAPNSIILLSDNFTRSEKDAFSPIIEKIIPTLRYNAKNSEKK